MRRRSALLARFTYMLLCGDKRDVNGLIMRVVIERIHIQTIGSCHCVNGSPWANPRQYSLTLYRIMFRLTEIDTKVEGQRQ